MNMRCTRRVPAVVLAVLAAGPALADITVGQIDDFQDGTLQDWGNGIIESLVTNEDGGPLGAGDRFLQTITTGLTNGPGSRLAVFNREQWTGDYLAAGVTSISMDVANFTPSDTQLELRVMLFSDTGSVFTSTVASVVAADGQWTTVTFDVTEGGLTMVDGLFTYQESITAINRLLVRHQPGEPQSVGAAPHFRDGVMGLDNIRALPAPGTLALVPLAGALLVRRRR